MAQLSGITKSPRDDLNLSSSLDDAPHLVGQLNSDGIASLTPDPAYSTLGSSGRPGSLRAALEAVADSGRNTSDTSSETASEEDYDALKHDPMTVVKGGRGGGFLTEDAMNAPETNISGKTYGKSSVNPSKLQPGPAQLRSM